MFVDVAANDWCEVCLLGVALLFWLHLFMGFMYSRCFIACKSGASTKQEQDACSQFIVRGQDNLYVGKHDTLIDSKTAPMLSQISRIKS